MSGTVDCIPLLSFFLSFSFFLSLFLFLSLSDDMHFSESTVVEQSKVEEKAEAIVSPSFFSIYIIFPQNSCFRLHSIIYQVPVAQDEDDEWGAFDTAARISREVISIFFNPSLYSLILSNIHMVSAIDSK